MPHLAADLIVLTTEEVRALIDALPRSRAFFEHVVKHQKGSDVLMALQTLSRHPGFMEIGDDVG